MTPIHSGERSRQRTAKQTVLLCGAICKFQSLNIERRCMNHMHRRSMLFLPVRLKRCVNDVQLPISVTSFGSRMTQRPPVKSGMACGAPPAAMEAAEIADMLIHAAVS